MLPTSIERARYQEDIEVLECMRADDLLQRAMQKSELFKRRSAIRVKLLASAVRVQVELLPNVGRSFERLSALVPGDKPLEAYVFSDPQINAFLIDGGRSHIIGISSTAVAQLSAEELEFVIGHELGHAVYGHLDVAAEVMLRALDPTLEQARRIRAWQRASEISADRAGLVACGSLEVAASALFKTVCGLALPGVCVRAADFAAQWDHLATEMVEAGIRDQWQLSHPFPPLRMKALQALWDAPDRATADHATRRLLAFMDARTSEASRQQHDPLLTRFIYWGGMYIARSQGGPTAKQMALLRSFSATLGAPEGGAGLSADDCLQRFRASKSGRRNRLVARELHQIATHLISFAAAAGPISSPVAGSLHRLGGELGLNSRAIDLFIEKHSNQEYVQ